jgi:hypothetical protein
MGHMILSADDPPHKLRPRGHWNARGCRFYCGPWLSRSDGAMDELVHEIDAFPATLSATPSNRPSLLGRSRPAICDVRLFRSWLRTCTDSHVECPRRLSRGNIELRVVDVVNMCLVTVDDEQRSSMQYSALRCEPHVRPARETYAKLHFSSYVWGPGPKTFRLTKANYHDYCQPHGLPQLPNTISDAIDLTGMLEQRYLWVDSLCIISDDAVDKAIQIPQMASIYGHALLTTVAAVGEDADHGLAGLHIPRTEHNVVDIGVCHIVQSHAPCKRCHGESKTIRDSTWATRAWTL